MEVPVHVGARSDSRLETYFRPESWGELNADLTISVDEGLPRAEPITFERETLDTVAALLRTEGHFQLPPVDALAPIDAMASAILRLSHRGFMPVFSYMYDEFWVIWSRLRLLLAELLGPEYRMLPDFWAWHVDPHGVRSGWPPHRDKGATSLLSDGRPKSVTVWIPLTNATPLNGCIYIVPADLDPTYNTDREREYRFKLQDVRALPSTAGAVLCWNQAVVHWGGRTSERAHGPRISIACEFQRGDVPPFNTPLIDPLTCPTVSQRLALIAKQVLQYQHMYPLSPELRSFVLAALEHTQP